MAGIRILAHDVGTSGDKACIYDTEIGFLAEAKASYPTWQSQGSCAEQSPPDWWEAFRKTTQEVLLKAGIGGSEIAAVSFGGQSNSLVPVDKRGELLAPKVMIWMDSRARKEGDYLIRSLGKEEYFSITGITYDCAGKPPAKLLWMKRNHPGLYENTFRFLDTKEYLIMRLTGCMDYCDYTEASGSGMFDIRKKDYSPEILGLCGIDRSKLMTPEESSRPVGGLLKAEAEGLGLKCGIPVFQGAWDTYACALGTGLRNEKRQAAYLGTCGWIGAEAGELLPVDNMGINITYTGEERYFYSVHTHAACAAYDWVVKNINAHKQQIGSLDYERAEKLAARAEPGAGGLFFLPSILHGNTRYTSSSLAGSYLGIRPEHEASHLLRAAMEGVGYDMILGASALECAGLMKGSLRITGGGTRSGLWMEIMSSMLGRPVYVPEEQQFIGAGGAALLAADGLGINISQAAPNGREICYEPEETLKAYYASRLSAVEGIYERMMELYEFMKTE